MILIDGNLLIYAWATGMQQHLAARSWLDARLSDEPRIGFPWPSILAFVRIVSNPRVFEQPATVAEAWRQVEAWLACEPAWIPGPTDRHAQVLGSLLNSAVSRSNLVPDAHLAALAIEHGLVLCSADGDFARFPGLQWRNPLAPSPPKVHP